MIIYPVPLKNSYHPSGMDKQGCTDIKGYENKVRWLQILSRIQSELKE